MEIKTLEDIQDLVAEYREVALLVGDWYFLIKKEFVNEIDGWLFEYSNSEQGRWFEYEFMSIKNEPRVYILRFYIE